MICEVDIRRVCVCVCVWGGGGVERHISNVFVLFLGVA